MKNLTVFNPLIVNIVKDAVKAKKIPSKHENSFPVSIKTPAGRTIHLSHALDFHQDDEYEAIKKGYTDIDEKAKIQFHAMHPDYNFVHQDKKGKFIIQPNDGKPFEFFPYRSHGVYHKDELENAIKNHKESKANDIFREKTFNPHTQTHAIWEEIK